MIRVMFVCHGNICRSPMAEFIMKDLVKKAGLDNEFYIASAAVSSEELGNPVYPPAREELYSHGISCKGKYAVKLAKNEYDRYDLFVIMDESNRRNIMRIFGSDPQNKVHKLLDYTDTPRDVTDPWYSRRFDKAYSDILKGCQGLLKHLMNEYCSPN